MQRICAQLSHSHAVAKPQDAPWLQPQRMPLLEVTRAAGAGTALLPCSGGEPVLSRFGHAINLLVPPEQHSVPVVDRGLPLLAGADPVDDGQHAADDCDNRSDDAKRHGGLERHS
eukprot:CAMPEP_0206057186 /NCGR_PEP_ID=MMETSP1466-20131121/43852_1 /ASSEMBLY_ACC=CAM_ASM_001126 /TAXON_ID=44452 /ORGANISM="Pavlova gyrans, Strain CCMP608" /LENGTH=114 /DNA_ID=CAMNT_0053432453 /DNA_START=374 /DNA_END=718 /DNA_ORIENTATION=-